MNCPKCGSKTRVFDISLHKVPNVVFRKRECLGCGFIFTSFEKEMTNIGDRTEN